MAQLEDNLASIDLELSAEEIARLDEVSADRTQYPYWMITRNNSTRIPTGEPVPVGSAVPGANKK